MTEETVIELAQYALTTVFLVASPMLGLALLVGLTISIFQATTQIQEQTLTFVPKILAVLGSILVFGPWMLRIIIEFTYTIYNNMNTFIN